MVFHSHIEMNETPASKSSNSSIMASPTTVVKSKTTQKPLHNFSLPDLKWAMNHTNTNRFRKPSESSRKSPQNSTVSEKSKHNQTRHNQNKNKSLVLKAGDAIEKLAKRKSFGDDVVEKLVKKPAVAAGAGSSSGDGSRSKIFIRIKTKSSKVTDQVANAGDHNSVVPDDDSDDLLVPKTWNFRPRRLVTKINNNNNNNVDEGGALKIGGGAALEIKAPEKKEKEKENGKDKDKEMEKETDKDKEKEKINKEKTKFSISLKKEEIEDDFFALTGTKPPRRPKKRAKNVQKQLDYVFPGLWLASITPDSYKVNDGTKKIKG